MQEMYECECGKKFTEQEYSYHISVCLPHLSAVRCSSVIKAELVNVNTEMDTVLQEVRQERFRQDKKWGQQNHHPVEWLSILGEEFGEVSKAICEAHFGYENGETWDDYREELIQTAAVAVAMVECLDRNGPPKKKG